MELIPEQVDRLIAIVDARQRIYHDRLKGDPWPWSLDPIWQMYRFPNMYREQDKVTTWIRNNWRNSDEHNWFAMCVARFCNWPESLAEIGYPIPWDRERFIRVLEDRKRRGWKVFTGAYVIAAGPGDSKIKYIASILDELWEEREFNKPELTDTLKQFYTRLRDTNGLGTFMAAQIVADVKYGPWLAEAADWWEWAAPGPGSLKGLNRVVGRPVSASWAPDVWLGLINELRVAAWDRLQPTGLHPEPHAQDAQGFCCEFDKYERTRLGEGRPRSKYEVPS